MIDTTRYFHVQARGRQAFYNTLTELQAAERMIADDSLLGDHILRVDQGHVGPATVYVTDYDHAIEVREIPPISPDACPPHGHFDAGMCPECERQNTEYAAEYGEQPTPIDICADCGYTEYLHEVRAGDGSHEIICGDCLGARLREDENDIGTVPYRYVVKAVDGCERFCIKCGATSDLGIDPPDDSWEDGPVCATCGERGDTSPVSVKDLHR